MKKEIKSLLDEKRFWTRVFHDLDCNEFEKEGGCTGLEYYATLDCGQKDVGKTIKICCINCRKVLSCKDACCFVVKALEEEGLRNGSFNKG